MTSIAVILPFAIVKRSALTNRPSGATTTPIAPFTSARLPRVAEAFAHLGFPDYFRVELSWAKLLGVVLLLVPVPARLKEWAKRRRGPR
ncbi:MAG: DoxX family protein [Thermoanaerobaculia bacterium]